MLRTAKFIPFMFKYTNKYFRIPNPGNRVIRPDSEGERRERASRRETRLARELRERKYRELQFQMNTTLTGGLLSTMTSENLQ